MRVSEPDAPATNDTEQPYLLRPRQLAAALMLGALSAAGGLSLGPNPATAQASRPADAERVIGGMFDASDPEALVRLMSRLGYVAELAADEDGAPIIKGRLSRTDYFIQFYECEGGAFCNSVQFFAAGPRSAASTLETVNTFNTTWRYVRATLAADQVHLRFDVNLDAGVTGDNFEDTLDIWRRLIETFERDLLAAK
ncbi:YbjN domain-containing protein [bacterium]|nr:YbjN domain-containing protein [bacterium]